jgi:hypothetical protein
MKHIPDRAEEPERPAKPGGASVQAEPQAVGLSRGLEALRQTAVPPQDTLLRRGPGLHMHRRRQAAAAAEPGGKGEGHLGSL